MLRAKVKIPGYNDGNWVDTFDAFGLVYLDSDKRVGFDLRPLESISYPEENGEYVLPKTVLAPFDYKIKFFVQANSVVTVNQRIHDFNIQLYTEDQNTHIRTYKRVVFYNICKRHRIEGYPQEIALATDFWRDPTSQVNDIAIVEWTIRAVDPSSGKCNFNYTQ